MNKEKLVPELRFENYPNNWESKKIKDLFTFSKGKGVSKDDISENGKNKVVLYGELNTHYGWQINEVISRTNLEKEKYVLSKKNQILLPSSGYVPTDMVCPVVIRENDVILSGDTNILTPNDYDGGFLALAFRASKKELSKVVQGTTVRHLYNNQIGTKEIKITDNIEEQLRISNFISNIDKRIKLLEQIKDLNKQYKKGLLQQMFVSNSAGGGVLNVPFIRFKEFTKDWIMVKIGDIFELKGGKTISRKVISKIKTDTKKYPVYSSQTTNGGLAGYFEEYSFEDSITWTTRGAHAGEVNFRKGRFHCSPLCGVLISNQGYCNQCLSEILNKEAWKFVVHSNIPSITNEVVSEITIIIPPTIKEQEKISYLLENIDYENNENEKEIKDLKIWKKGLLQRMFV